MRADMSAGPPDCSAEFRKRRNRLILIAFPLAAAMLIAYEAFEDPSFQMYGLDHAQTLWFGIGATAFLLGLNLIDWRCPSCNTYLNAGISIPFCKRCGALFVPPPADKAGPAAAMSYPDPQLAAEARRAQAETALQSEINQHRNACVLRIMKAVVVIGLGALMAFVLDPGPGKENVARLFGGGTMVLGLAWIAWEARSISKVKQQLTEQYRDLLGLDR